MTDAKRYDAAIIGAGQAGVPLSTTLARAGWKVALIESEHVGGTCVNEGCTPTKTMVASARGAYVARRGPDYGVGTGAVTVDMRKVRQRKRDIVERFRAGAQRRIESTPGLDLIFGRAAFTGPKTVEVQLRQGGSLVLTAEKVFINTGTRPSIPPIEGLADAPFLDSSSIMELDSVPDHLVILGGGYVGLEFGQMFCRFGSQITIIEAGDQLLSREDGDVAGEIANILGADGIGIALKTNVLAAGRQNSGIHLRLSSPQGERTINGSHLLVATGRRPNTDSLNLAAAGIRADQRGFIPVNERLETNVEGVYALGDVNGGPGFTHISYDDYRIIRANLLEGRHATTRGRLVPYVVYIDPQLGRIGMTEQQARDNGRQIRIAKLPMTSVARALETGETRGFIKAVVDAASNQVLGAAVLGPEGGEVMSIIETAMAGQLPYTWLKDAVFAHPTLAESLNNLFMALDDAA